VATRARRISIDIDVDRPRAALAGADPDYAAAITLVEGNWPRGALPALHDWLKTSAAADFEVRRDLEIYGISCHPEGFLQRR
jgi:hypothetical protein